MARANRHRAFRGKQLSSLIAAKRRDSATRLCLARQRVERVHCQQINRVTPRPVLASAPVIDSIDDIRAMNSLRGISPSPAASAATNSPYRSQGHTGLARMPASRMPKQAAPARGAVAAGCMLRLPASGPRPVRDQSIGYYRNRAPEHPPVPFPLESTHRRAHDVRPLERAFYRAHIRIFRGHDYQTRR